jgi:hypothetical protein
VGFVTPRERLESKIDRSGGPDACHVWLASVGSHGYGNHFDLSMGGVTTAPRAAFYYEHGRLPNVVRHRCPGGPDKLCCNPRHLRDGTHRLNALDRAEDGTQRFGETNGNAVLTREIVADARRRVAAGEPSQCVAASYGVNPMTLRSAIRGDSWGWLADPAPWRINAP